MPLGVLNPALHPETSMQIQLQLLVTGGEEGFFFLSSEAQEPGHGGWARVRPMMVCVQSMGFCAAAEEMGRLSI